MGAEVMQIILALLFASNCDRSGGTLNIVVPNWVRITW